MSLSLYISPCAISSAAVGHRQPLRRDHALRSEISRQNKFIYIYIYIHIYIYTSLSLSIYI